MQTSDFIKGNSDAAPAYVNGGGRSQTTRVVIDGKEYCKKQLAQAYKGDLRMRMALYKEFNVGSLLDSPYIVKYKEINEDEQGLYVLMEHVNGMSVADKMAAEPTYFANLHNVMRLLRQLLKALKALHSCNVAYLDLKPENIMLTQVSNEVKLIDLGGCFADSNSFTAERTNAYAAPELAQNQIGELDARTDIYGVGKLMEYIEKHAGVKLPKYIRKVKLCCLNRDKALRYSTADEVLNALNRKAQMIRAALCGVAIVAACTLGWQWYITTEHYRCLMLQRRSNALVEDIYYAKNKGDSATCRVIGFRNKEKLGSLYLREKVVIDGKEHVVTEIADSAFMDFSEIASVNLPRGLRKIGAGAFFGCEELVTVTLPEGFVELGHACFKETGVRNVSFPKSLKSVGHASFAACHNITELVIPEGVETLELDAFACCHGLKSVQLPSTLKIISRGVFWDCPNLEEVCIPAGVGTIGEYAFYHCRELKHVYNYAPEPQAVSVIFNQKELTIHVPAEAVERYRNASHWKKFTIVGDL